MLIWLCDVSRRWGIAYNDEEVQRAHGMFSDWDKEWSVEDGGQGLGGAGGMNVEGESDNAGSSSSSSSFPLSSASTPPPFSAATAVLLSDWDEACLDPFTFSNRCLVLALSCLDLPPSFPVLYFSVLYSTMKVCYLYMLTSDPHVFHLL